MAIANKAKTETLPVRCSKSDVELIDKASQMLNVNRSEFVREAILDRARETMLDNSNYEFSLKNFLEFEKIISAPAKDNAALKAILKSKSPWE